jgi:hypothetical protein
MQTPPQSDVDPEAVQSSAHGLHDLMQRISASISGAAKPVNARTTMCALC